MSFNQFNLESRLLKAIDKCGFTEATDIQTESIPHVLAGRDVMACAQTGTGKTAAFVLPALHRLLENPGKNGPGPRVLILTPTRELAAQVNDNINQLGRFCNVKTGNVVGGMPYPPQIRMLSQSTDFIVATPGRLIDHLRQGRVALARVEMLILDEADRMLDMGFFEDVQEIVKHMPPRRQTLLFSATFEGPIVKVASQALNNPVKISLSRQQKVNRDIEQYMHLSDSNDHKYALLNHYLNTDTLYQAIVFTATKMGAERLAKRLAGQGHQADSLHGDMRQSKRDRTIERLRRGKTRVLVATDVAARGLDVTGISHVINYDLPRVAEDYIHRIGRTGRGGQTGIAISLVVGDQFALLRAIEQQTGETLRRSIVDGLEPANGEPKIITKKSARKNSKKRGGQSQGRSRGFSKDASAKPKQKAKRDSQESFAPKVRSKKSKNASSQSARNGQQTELRQSTKSAKPKRFDDKPASSDNRKPAKAKRFDDSQTSGEKRKPAKTKSFNESQATGDKRKPKKAKSSQRPGRNARLRAKAEKLAQSEAKGGSRGNSNGQAKPKKHRGPKQHSGERPITLVS